MINSTAPFRRPGHKRLNSIQYFILTSVHTKANKQTKQQQKTFFVFVFVNTELDLDKNIHNPHSPIHLLRTDIIKVMITYLQDYTNYQFCNRIDNSVTYNIYYTIT